MEEHARGSSVDDRVAYLLLLFGYGQHDRYIRARVDMPLRICGTFCHAITDVCVVDGRTKIRLLVCPGGQAIPGGSVILNLKLLS